MIRLHFKRSQDFESSPESSCFIKSGFVLFHVGEKRWSFAFRSSEKANGFLDLQLR